MCFFGNNDRERECTVTKRRGAMTTNKERTTVKGRERMRREREGEREREIIAKPKKETEGQGRVVVYGSSPRQHILYE